MKWKKKIPIYPKSNEVKYTYPFVWMPTLINGYYIWLEKIKVEWTYNRHSYQHNSEPGTWRVTAIEQLNS